MSVAFITFALFCFPHVRFGFLKPRPLISFCALQFYFIHRIRRKRIQRIVSLKKYVGDRTRTNEMEMGALESQRGIQNLFSEQFFSIPTVLLVDFNVFYGMPTIARITFKFAPFLSFTKPPDKLLELLGPCVKILSVVALCCTLKIVLL